MRFTSKLKNFRCKHRKCDGERPTCGNCKRRGIECVYIERKRRTKKNPPKRKQPESDDEDDVKQSKVTDEKFGEEIVKLDEMSTSQRAVRKESYHQLFFQDISLYLSSLLLNFISEYRIHPVIPQNVFPFSND